MLASMATLNAARPACIGGGQRDRVILQTGGSIALRVGDIRDFMLENPAWGNSWMALDVEALARVLSGIKNQAGHR